jgi:hypothetical protein
MKTRKNVGCSDATFRGLNKWYQSMFETLGWMVLSKEKGMSYKLPTYKTSLQKLKCALQKKIDYINDRDKKKDLEIMLENVEILIRHAAKDL